VAVVFGRVDVCCPRVGLLVIWNPSVYMNSFGYHAGKNGRVRVLSIVTVFECWDKQRFRVCVFVVMVCLNFFVVS